MLKLALILISALSLATSSAFAASYQQNDGTIIDPIQLRGGGDHPYSGNNLEPGATLSDAFLSAAILTNADLTAAFLSDAFLSAAILTNADLTGADLTGAFLDGADLTDADLTDANLLGADLIGADLTGAFLTDADLTDANLLGADLTAAFLSDAFLTNADLTGADLTGAFLDGANLSGARLDYATTLYTTVGAALYDSDTDFTGTGFDPVAAGWTLVPVPEPSTALLMGLGLAGLATIRRR